MQPLLQTLLNGINIVGSIYFGLHLGWAVEGVAFGTILGEATAAIVGFLYIMRGFDRAHAPAWSHVFERVEFLRLVSVNRDIMIRSFALLAGFSLFTRTGAQFGAAVGSPRSHLSHPRRSGSSGRTTRGSRSSSSPAS